MATREKKLSINRKQNTSSPLPPKEDLPPPDIKPPLNNEPAEENANTKAPSLAKKLAPKSPKKLSKKPIAIKVKPTIKRLVKNKRKIMKLVSNPKNSETKKNLLKNCVKQIKPKKPKIVKTEENLPPVLEPILPIDEDSDNKQVKKKGKRPPRIDNYAKNDDPVKAKRVYKRKIKTESTQNETIEDVINDLNTLIKSGDIKEESDVVSESGKSDSIKPKKVIKKRKKENIENTLSKLSPAQRKVIDMLDLNVSKFKGLPVVNKRRHSIEKFPIGIVDTEGPNLSRLSIFNNLPRCISPRSKNFPRLRQTVDGFSRRSNPYKTRSDSPARILRNGKQRKLKDLELLEGLDMTHKRRRRNYSEFSGSEMSLSRFSGYESDSSFSDLSSVHGAENPENKEIESIKREKIEEIPAIKRSLSTENDTNNQNFTDTNSNLCINKENTAPVKNEPDLLTENIASTPSSKVPEKSIILDIMKQAFNDSFEDKDDKKITQGKSGKPNIEEEIVKDEKDEIVCETQTENTETPVENGESKIENVEETEVLQNGDVYKPPIEETPENLAIKENILQALGLQSLKAAKEARLSKEKAEPKNDYYTGTLKAVIKINRGEKKKGRNNMKMTLHKNKKSDLDNGVEDSYKTKEVSLFGDFGDG